MEQALALIGPAQSLRIGNAAKPSERHRNPPAADVLEQIGKVLAARLRLDERPSRPERYSGSPMVAQVIGRAFAGKATH